MMPVFLLALGATALMALATVALIDACVFFAGAADERRRRAACESWDRHFQEHPEAMGNIRADER